MKMWLLQCAGLKDSSEKFCLSGAQHRKVGNTVDVAPMWLNRRRWQVCRQWRCVFLPSSSTVCRWRRRCLRDWPAGAGTSAGGPSTRRPASESVFLRARPRCTTATRWASVARRAVAAPSSTCRSSSSRYISGFALFL